VPDPKYGENICAWVKLKQDKKATEQEIKDFCKEQIAYYKVIKKQGRKTQTQTQTQNQTQNKIIKNTNKNK